MSIHPFVFSNNPRYRIGRHATFWITWILYYAIISTFSFAPKYGVTRSFFECLTEVALSTPLDMCFCYFIIYFLFPRFLYKGRYIGMLSLWLFASIFFIAAFELNGTYIVPYIRSWFDFAKPPPMMHSLSGFFNLFSQINMEGCVAASIKLGKMWYVKQQEIDLLKNEKEKINPHKDEGLMQPAFLADLLSRMETLADVKPVVAGQSIKKIRNLITYMLYENSQAKVSLQNELSLLEEYIYLEQITANENVKVETKITSGVSSETIAPFILLPLVENAFRQVLLQPVAQKFISIKIDVHQGILQVSIHWNKPVDTSTLAKGRNIILQNISRRLKLIYPQSHELKVVIEVENVHVNLTVDLKKAIN